MNKDTLTTIQLLAFMLETSIEAELYKETGLMPDSEDMALLIAGLSDRFKEILAGMTSQELSTQKARSNAMIDFLDVFIVDS